MGFCGRRPQAAADESDQEAGANCEIRRRSLREDWKRARHRRSHGADQKLDPPGELVSRQMRQGAPQRGRKAGDHRLEVPLDDIRQHTLRVQSPHQAHELRVSRGVFRNRKEEGFQDPLRRGSACFRLRFGPVQKRQTGLIHRRYLPEDNRVEQLLFRPEVVVNRRQIDAGLADDVAQRNSIITTLAEEPLGRIQNLLLGINHMIKSIALIIRLNDSVSTVTRRNEVDFRFGFCGASGYLLGHKNKATAKTQRPQRKTKADDNNLATVPKLNSVPYGSDSGLWHERQLRRIELPLIEFPDPLSIDQR